MSEQVDTRGMEGRNGRWRRVERARARLEANSHRIMQAMIDRALAGDTKAGRWLLEHTATTDDQGRELRPIARSVDMPSASDWAEKDASQTPRIVIGVSLGADFAQLATPPAPRAIGTGATPAALPARSALSHSVSPTPDRQE